MIGIDTNVLVRYLTADDKAQFEIAAKLLEKESSLHVGLIVLCELLWILDACYHLSHEQQCHTLKALLSVRQLVFEKRAIVQKSVEIFEESSVDFSDILIGLLNQENGCPHTATFDKKLKKLDGFQVL